MGGPRPRPTRPRPKEGPGLEGLGTGFDKTDRPGLDFTAIQTS